MEYHIGYDRNRMKRYEGLCLYKLGEHQNLCRRICRRVQGEGLRGMGAYLATGNVMDGQMRGQR